MTAKASFRPNSLGDIVVTVEDGYDVKEELKGMGFRFDGSFGGYEGSKKWEITVENAKQNMDKVRKIVATLRELGVELYL